MKGQVPVGKRNQGIAAGGEITAAEDPIMVEESIVVLGAPRLRPVVHGDAGGRAHPVAYPIGELVVELKTEGGFTDRRVKETEQSEEEEKYRQQRPGSTGKRHGGSG